MSRRVREILRLLCRMLCWSVMHARTEYVKWVDFCTDQGSGNALSPKSLARLIPSPGSTYSSFPPSFNIYSRSCFKWCSMVLFHLLGYFLLRSCWKSLWRKFNPTTRRTSSLKASRAVMAVAKQLRSVLHTWLAQQVCLTLSMQLTDKPPAALECHRLWVCTPRSLQGGSPQWGGAEPPLRPPASHRKASQRLRKRKRRRPFSCWAGCDFGRPKCCKLQRGLRWPWRPLQGSPGCWGVRWGRCYCCCRHCHYRSWKLKALVVGGWWWTWKVAAQEMCAQASSRSRSGRTRHIPGYICQSWLRQAGAGCLQEKKKERTT